MDTETDGDIDTDIDMHAGGRGYKKNLILCSVNSIVVQVQCSSTIASHADSVTFLFEIEAQDLRDVFFIFDDENIHRSDPRCFAGLDRPGRFVVNRNRFRWLAGRPCQQPPRKTDFKNAAHTIRAI